MAKDSIDKALFGIMYVYCYEIYSLSNNNVVAAGCWEHTMLLEALCEVNKRGVFLSTTNGYCEC